MSVSLLEMKLVTLCLSVGVDEITLDVRIEESVSTPPAGNHPKTCSLLQFGFLF